MGALYRSEEMTKCQLFLQTDAAYNCVAELGELGLVQFKDLNVEVNAFQRKYVNEIRRCDEMERKLRFLEKEIKKDGIPMLETGENPDVPQSREMIDLEATFEKLEMELREVNTNETSLKKNYRDLLELKHILRKSQAFFDEHESQLGHIAHSASNASPFATNGGISHQGSLRSPSNGSAVGSSIEVEEAARGREKTELNYLCGVILREKLPPFELLMWRVCRGNAYLKTVEITEPLEDPVTQEEVHKIVFLVFFQGDQLKTRIRKICEGFRATLYPVPDTPQERREVSIGILNRIEDLKIVLGQTRDHRYRVLVAAAKNIRLWLMKVRKIKGTYFTLNMFNIDVTQKCLLAECWCPTADMDKIQLALKRGTDQSGGTIASFLHKMDTHETPPTFFRTNKFTKGFQNIVDAYGVASYGEINPAPFTIISFPFLFAVMFGDAGHGAIMLAFALFLVTQEKRLTGIKDEIFRTFFGGRYIILLMSLFSIYTGLVYNDIFSLSVNGLGSSWRPNILLDDFVKTKPSDKGNVTYDFETASWTLDPNTTAFKNYPYGYGMDPIWYLASNKLAFLNSFKMKMSVVIGVFHMMFGVFLSALNYWKKRQWLNLTCSFLPQLLFLTCIFFYLSVEILYKWVNFGAAANGDYVGSSCAPSLLIGLINMFMFSQQPYSATGDTSHGPCSLNQYYKAQGSLETLLVVVAVLTIPWMFAIKPIVLICRKRRQQVIKAADRQPLLNLPLKRISSQSHADSTHSASYHGEAEYDDDETSAQVELNKGESHSSDSGGHDDHDNVSTGDLWVLQAIHTIEYCLSCISHTASYLRLWALSLAHAQLSEVLWTMVMRNSFKLIGGYAGCIVVFVIFIAFSALTLAILIVMEGLSAFLHALRLHWVEFNSKFYQGEGHLFTPFSFDTIMEEAQEMDEKLQAA